MDTKRRTVSEIILSVFRRGFHFFNQKLIAPKSPDEDLSRKEFILNILLVGTIATLCILFSFLTHNAIIEGIRYQGISISLFGGIILLFLVLLFLSRRGFVNTASHGLIIILFIGATYGAFHFGGDLQQVLLTYVVIIIIASILMSTFYGFIVTAIISATLLVLWHLQIHDIIIPQTYWKYQPAENDAIEFVVMFFLMMIVSWLSNREIKRSLVRARSSEQALARERDLLEIKVEERTRELKHTQLEKVSQLYRFAEFGKLSAGIFHDLMTPLGAIIANVDQLEHNQTHLPEVKSYLQKAVIASRRMGSFLTTIRKQIRVSTDKELFSANKELSETLDILQYKARMANVAIKTNLKREFSLYGNPIKFHQVLLNLISNAIDSYDHAPKENERVIYTILTKRDKSLMIKVTDFGIGIQPEILSKIFEPFMTTKDSTKGIGLGLSSTKEIIEKDFGGTITVTSTPNKGSSFTVFFKSISEN